MLVGVTLFLTALTILVGLRWDMLASWVSELWRSSTKATETSPDYPNEKEVSAIGQEKVENIGMSSEETEDPHENEDVILRSAESTPKAKPITPTLAVPSFTLEEPSNHQDQHNGNISISHIGEEEDEEEYADDVVNMPPPSFPALNSAQRASGTRSLGPPTLKPLSNSGLMPPPSRPNASLRTPPSAAASLRAPSNGPLPNRGSPRMNGLAVPQGVAIKTPNPRQKVLLEPGHSPLDWASLQRSGKNLAGVSGFQRVTMSQLKEMNGRKGKPAWSSYQGKVYNISPYLPFHPGGEGELRRVAGKDGERLFMEVHPWVNWDNMLDGCFVGMLVPDREVPDKSLEDLD